MVSEGNKEMSEKDTDIHTINGSKTSGHKPPYELITQTLLRRTAERLRLGAVKHGRWNWKKGAETKEYALDRLSHAFEHVTSAMAKIENDEPVGDDDLAAVVVNCMFAMYYQEWTKGYDSSQLCQWPGCTSVALCESGNFGNKLVCPEHFKITNGTESKPVFSFEGVESRDGQSFVIENSTLKYQCKNCGIQFSHTPLQVTTIPPLANYNNESLTFFFHNEECKTTWLRNPRY